MDVRWPLSSRIVALHSKRAGERGISSHLNRHIRDVGCPQENDRQTDRGRGLVRGTRRPYEFKDVGLRIESRCDEGSVTVEPDRIRPEAGVAVAPPNHQGEVFETKLMGVDDTTADRVAVRGIVEALRFCDERRGNRA